MLTNHPAHCLRLRSCKQQGAARHSLDEPLPVALASLLWQQAPQVLAKQLAGKACSVSNVVFFCRALQAWVISNVKAMLGGIYIGMHYVAAGCTMIWFPSDILAASMPAHYSLRLSCCLREDAP